MGEGGRVTGEGGAGHICNLTGMVWPTSVLALLQGDHEGDNRVQCVEHICHPCAREGHTPAHSLLSREHLQRLSAVAHPVPQDSSRAAGTYRWVGKRWAGEGRVKQRVVQSEARPSTPPLRVVATESCRRASKQCREKLSRNQSWSAPPVCTHWFHLLPSLDNKQANSLFKGSLTI